MKVFNDGGFKMTRGLNSSLQKVRVMRGFSARKYVKAKTLMIDEYCKKTGLDTAIIGISGGIDSAVVYCLLREAIKLGGLKKIVPVSLPVHGNFGATNQKEAVQRAKILVGDELIIFDVVKSVNLIVEQVKHNFLQEDNWAVGQLSSYVRTPYLYYLTSVFSAMGNKPFIAGTTNRDEGSYLGYVGKASDGMVDVQVVSDLHKSEIYEVAKFLGVPEEIIKVAPSGDMFDGRVDEEVFGTTYDFVELYLAWLNASYWLKGVLQQDWNDEDEEAFDMGEKNIEGLHKYNQHKYWVGSPAVHLDVQQSAVQGGWIEGIHSGLYKGSNVDIVNTDRFVGFVEQPPYLSSLIIPKKEEIKKNIFRVSNLLSKDEIKGLLDWREFNWEKSRKTNEYGYAVGKGGGSSRLSFYSEDFSKILLERIKLSGLLSDTMIFNDLNTNWHDSVVWKVVGVNPMFRLMQYDVGDFLLPHYDDSYYKNNKQRSLLTLVISIAESDKGGATRFLNDIQNNIEYSKRNFSDWDCEPIKEDIYISINHFSGGGILFPHRLLHDGERVIGGRKIILRSEIIFEQCNPRLIGG